MNHTKTNLYAGADTAKSLMLGILASKDTHKNGHLLRQEGPPDQLPRVNPTF